MPTRRLAGSFTVALLASAAAASAQVVYRSDFQNSQSAGWSGPRFFADDAGRRVLGVYEVATPVFSLNLPAGAYEIAFDFYNINTWDGNGMFFSGPDTFAFHIQGVRNIGAAFSNSARPEQTYSNATPFGGGPFLGGTDSAGAQELRITRAAVIGVYRYRWRFPFSHAGGIARFEFAGRVSTPGRLYQGFTDECWALDAVVVTRRCYADCDTSTGPGILDIFDFLCFQNRYAALDPYACDCDTSTGPGVCDIFDFLCFQNAFAAGCP